MPVLIKVYVKTVDGMNYHIGRAIMYMIFVMMGVLFYSSLTKVFSTPSLWTFEFSQFMMVAYFLVGGAYSMQLDGHVRMDLLYGGRSERTKRWLDTVTALFMITFLVGLLYGAISSTEYALHYGERSYSSWRPYMWPIKIIMTIGIVMMLLQAISQFFKDLAAAIGKPIS